jgi:hypothetical protein
MRQALGECFAGAVVIATITVPSCRFRKAVLAFHVALPATGPPPARWRIFESGWQSTRLK